MSENVHGLEKQLVKGTLFSVEFLGENQSHLHSSVQAFVHVDQILQAGLDL